MLESLHGALRISLWNEQVISRGSGMSMGVISHFFADPDTLSVVSANLRPKGIFGNTPLQAKVGNVMLETFCQVGDVVLVHDESALEYSPTSGRYRGTPQDERGGFVNLIGCQICTSQGQSLGKVSLVKPLSSCSLFDRICPRFGACHSSVPEFLFCNYAVCFS